MSYVVLYQHHYCDKVLCRSTYEAAAHGGDAGKYVKVIVVESNVGEDDEWSNDSAVFTGSDVASRQ